MMVLCGDRAALCGGEDDGQPVEMELSLRNDWMVYGALRCSAYVMVASAWSCMMDRPFDLGLEADVEWEWMSLAMTSLICWQCVVVESEWTLVSEGMVQSSTCVWREDQLD